MVIAMMMMIILIVMMITVVVIITNSNNINIFVDDAYDDDYDNIFNCYFSREHTNVFKHKQTRRNSTTET